VLYACARPDNSTMPPKPANELTAVEGFLLNAAARLLTAVQWLAEHPPLEEKWDYLNIKVKEEIVSTHIIDLYSYTKKYLGVCECEVHRLCCGVKDTSSSPHHPGHDPGVESGGRRPAQTPLEPVHRRLYQAGL
jgi:hypothetical protein